MKSKVHKKRLSLIIVIVVAVLFGIVQEKIKLGLNNTLKRAELIQNYDQLSIEERKVESKKLESKELPSYFSSQSGIDYLYRLELGTLKNLKWFFALIFISIFLVINASLLFLAFESKYLLKILLYTYLIFTLIAFSFYFAGSYVGEAKSGYGVGRKILGSLQSLIPTMILFPAFLIHQHTNKNDDNS